MEESNLMNELSKERKSIKTDSYDMSVGEIISLYKDGDLKLNPAYAGNEYIYVGDMKIEKEILRPAVSTKTMKRKSVKKRDEKIIFPYKLCSKGYIKYEQKEFEEKFPEAYKYLKSFYDKLNKRKSDEKAQWFEYGRSQAIAEIKGEKLIFPMVFTNKVKQIYLPARGI